jgi:hypothetical protein
MRSIVNLVKFANHALSRDTAIACVSSLHFQLDYDGHITILRASCVNPMKTDREPITTCSHTIFPSKHPISTTINCTPPVFELFSK